LIKKEFYFVATQGKISCSDKGYKIGNVASYVAYWQKSRHCILAFSVKGSDLRQDINKASIPLQALCRFFLDEEPNQVLFFCQKGPKGKAKPHSS
jgi:hypothetical protein